MQRKSFGIGKTCTLLVALACCSISARGQEIRWHPVAASGNVACLPGDGACGDTEIILSSGGVTVTMLMEVSDWDVDGGGHPGDTGYFLGAFQGTVESDSYRGGAPGNPGTVAGQDLIPVGSNTGFRFQGAFQALRVCGTAPCGGGSGVCDWDQLSDCGSNQGSTACGGAFPACIDRPDFVFDGLLYLPIVSTATDDYAWTASVSSACKEDPRDGSRFYVGTLLLEVPAGARGTYNVNFYDSIYFTLLNSCAVPATSFPGLVQTPGKITIGGSCCVGDLCYDWTTESECGGLGGIFRIGWDCAYECRRCGDDLVNQPSEECDGTDAAACPGACRADCTCPPAGGTCSGPDTDGDGIEDILDKDVGSPSKAWRDETTTPVVFDGNFVSGGSVVTVCDLPNPDGVEIENHSGPPVVARSFCPTESMDVRTLSSGDKVQFDCLTTGRAAGSTATAVATAVAGGFDVDLISESFTIATVTLSEGDSIQFTQETLEISAPPSNTAPLTVLIGEEQEELGPGDSMRIFDGGYVPAASEWGLLVLLLALLTGAKLKFRRRRVMPA